MSWDIPIGTEFAGYKITGVLGRGGMSVVYSAEHLGLGRTVALKVLASTLAADDSFRERFVRESKLAATLEHPNIIPIYDAGQAENSLYIAMRHVEGGDLGTLIKHEGPLSLGQTIFFIEQIASALDEAHRQGLVHRDVKPANILITRPSDRIYLTDFGVVKQTSTPGLTQTGYFLGTFAYAAPEQIQRQPVDGRTDIYALGCMLYECLSGDPPFDADTEASMLHAHLAEPPPKLTAKRPDLPHAIDDVIARAMAKAKEDRYPTAGELVRALRAGALGTSAVGQPAHSPETAPPPPAETVLARHDAAPAAAETVLAGPEQPLAETAAPPAPPPETVVPAAAQAPPVSETAASAGPPAPPQAPPAAPPPAPDSGVPPAPARERRTVTLSGARLAAVAAGLVAIVAIAVVAAVLLTGGGGSKEAATTTNGTPTSTGGQGTPTAGVAPGLAGVVPKPIFKYCTNAPANPGAAQTVSCKPQASTGGTYYPNSWQLSIYPNAAALHKAYDQLRSSNDIGTDFGHCSGIEWGGEGKWAHGPGKPGGRQFCYFDGNVAVIVWTHEKLGQASHIDLLGSARSNGSDHSNLFNWFRFWHHRIGKCAIPDCVARLT
jgi:Protein kinase domain